MVKKDQNWIALPLTKKADGPTAELVNMVSAKQMSRILRRKNGQTFIGLIRAVKDNEVLMANDGIKADPGSSEHVAPEDLPECVKVVLNEYQDVFPSDLPKGIQPIR